ncbi:MAG: 4'-phosphopantetheinyl transferase superfamily protein [Treponema sp.]|nr:4'-phosphopantetheinyl transferase superfamily protein [Candidatus Treponema caballi]
MLVYHTESVDYLKDDSLFAQCYARVPFYRKRKIDALKRPENRRLSLGAELLLEKMLCEAGFPELAKDRLGYYTKQGKPYILRPDQVPGENAVPPVYMSISHSRNYTMCALSDTVIGCDLEHADTERTNCPALARRFFCDEEARAVEADKSVFYKLWTLKEAYCKCTQTPLPVVLKMNMKEVLRPDSGLKMEQGEKDGFVWSIVYKA